MANKVLQTAEGVIFHEEIGIAISLTNALAMIRKAGYTPTERRDGILIAIPTQLEPTLIRPVFINNYGWLYSMKEIREVIEHD